MRDVAEYFTTLDETWAIAFARLGRCITFPRSVSYPVKKTASVLERRSPFHCSHRMVLLP